VTTLLISEMYMANIRKCILYIREKMYILYMHRAYIIHFTVINQLAIL